jgi:hypothetical protein
VSFVEGVGGRSLVSPLMEDRMVGQGLSGQMDCCSESVSQGIWVGVQ